MTDRTDDDLTPAQEETVRGLLADARHDDPMPPDVAARLDEVLAGLVARSAPAPVVVDLAAHRRRKFLVGLVAAAAVVVVAGIGVRAVTSGGSDDSSGFSESAAGGTAADARASDASSASVGAATAPEAPVPTPAAGTVTGAGGAGGGTTGGSGSTTNGGAVQTASASTYSSDQVLSGPPALHSTTFVADVRRLLRERTADTGAGTESGTGSGDAPGICGSGDYGDGELVAVTYDGTPAVLAIRPPTGQSQIVELLQCGSAHVLRSVTLAT